ncbi:hypothetical protein [Adhaeretor mobilis]|uniref:Uncharacterized protein n=1 Tax=Adhaeretor mobilis TaxID=1930276 RepID=A0A517MXJ5_9BACT|nr:hypothetical protein [Adhaeretor mobilis]QDS99600.1 hypothetical protein HG15A2_29260 [Adhaeretor mobilis]
MSSTDPNRLVSESEIQNALRIHRPDGTEFKIAVHQRLEDLCEEAITKRDPRLQQKSLDWLSTAAAFIPFPLLAKGAGGVLGKGVGANGPWAAKFIGWLASGPLILFLSAGGFVLGFQRIRSAQRRSSTAEPSDPATLRHSMSVWWNAYGAIHIAICVAATVLMWLGYTIPLLIVFIFYGAAIVVLVTKLGKEGFIDRATLAAGIASALMLFGQLVSVIAQLSRGTFLLDQSLASAIMCLGACIIALCGVLVVRHPLQRITAVFSAIPLLLLAALYGSSTLFPITPRDVQEYVESTEVDRFGSATWQQWAIAAGWLRDTKQPFDPTRPLELFEKELIGKQNPYVMTSAFRGGLVDLAAAKKLVPHEKPRESLVHPRLRGTRLLSIKQKAAEVLALEQLGHLTLEDRVVLADRLITTINHAVEDDHGNLVDVLIATQLLSAIGHLDATFQVRKSVRGMIVKFQRLDRQKLSLRAGGFSRYRTTDFGDEFATAVAVELMQTYGVPDEVDALALRSFLRPKATDWLNRHGAILRVVAFWRFDSLPDTPRLTLWDYLQCEHVIGMAFLAVLLSFTAVLGFQSQQTLAGASEVELKGM